MRRATRYCSASNPGLTCRCGGKTPPTCRHLCHLALCSLSPCVDLPVFTRLFCVRWVEQALLKIARCRHRRPRQRPHWKLRPGPRSTQTLATPRGQRCPQPTSTNPDVALSHPLMQALRGRRLCAWLASPSPRQFTPDQQARSSRPEPERRLPWFCAFPTASGAGAEAPPTEPTLSAALVLATPRWVRRSSKMSTRSLTLRAFAPRSRPHALVLTPRVLTPSRPHALASSRLASSRPRVLTPSRPHASRPHASRPHALARTLSSHEPPCTSLRRLYMSSPRSSLAPHATPPRSPPRFRGSCGRRFCSTCHMTRSRASADGPTMQRMTPIQVLPMTLGQMLLVMPSHVVLVR